MKSCALHEIRSVEQANGLPDKTTVYLSNVSPASWALCNRNYVPIMDALEARAPLGWEHIQLDGVCRYDLLVSSQTAEQILDARARRAGFKSHGAAVAEMERP